MVGGDNFIHSFIHSKQVIFKKLVQDEACFDNVITTIFGYVSFQFQLYFLVMLPVLVKSVFEITHIVDYVV